MSSILVLFLALLLPAPDEADDQYQFIAGLCEKGMYDMAVKEAEAFLKEHRGHAREAHARYRLATALFELERGAEAAPHFRRLLDLADFEFAAEAAFRLGECELRAGRFAEAEAALARVLELDRPYLRLPATFLLGEAAFRKGDFAAARPLYEQALATDAEGRYAREARYGIAWCRFRCGEYDAALAAIEEFTRLHRGDPLDGELRFLAGECLLEAGRPQEALAAYTQVEDGPFLDSALRGAGFALGELDEHAAAAEMFGKVVERVPESRYAAEATLQCGIHLLKAGQAEAAAAVLSSATAQEGAELCYWRSRARAAAGDPAGALADCERALALKPEAELCERCQVARGDLLFDLGRSAEAAEAYAASESDHALYSAAAASLNAGRPAGARQLAERLLAERKESSYAAAARAILGECLLAEEDYAGAAAQFLEAARSGDEAVKLSATERAGWCRFLNGEHAAAAEAFRWVVDHGQGAKEQEEALYMLGRACEGTGQQGAALRSFERHLAEHPEGAHRPDVLIALLRLGPAEAGVRHVQELLAQYAAHEGTPAALLGLADRLQQAGQAAAAEEHYRLLLERFPRHALAATARYGLAWALHERGEHAAAAKELRQLASQEGLAADLRAAALELLVFAELRAGDLDGAAESCARLREASPNGQKLLDAARAAAQALAKGGRAAEADALLASLDGAGAELCAAARIERAYISLEQGDPDAAEAHLSQALACAPEDPRLAEAAFFVAEALYERAEDARAVPLYEIAAKTPGGPAADRALYKGGFARMREGDAAGAAGSFARLAEEHPTSPLFGESLYLQGEMLYRLDRLDEAIACFERLRRASPGHEAMAKTLFRLGLAHCRDARWQEGEEALTELARRFPEFENGAEAELWRGRALSARGNARGARQALERVIARDRGVLAAQARIELGRLHGLAGDTEKALAEFLKVAVLFGGEAEVAEALFLAGQCLEKLGDADRARGQYQEIVQKHPQSPFAAQARARLDELKTF